MEFAALVALGAAVDFVLAGAELAEVFCRPRHRVGKESHLDAAEGLTWGRANKACQRDRSFREMPKKERKKEGAGKTD